MTNSRAIGTVLSLDLARGCGMIRREDGAGAVLYFRFDALRRGNIQDLRPGRQVAFGVRAAGSQLARACAIDVLPAV